MKRASRDRQLPLFEHGQELIVDLFAGGGGASIGIEAATGRTVDIAINHDAVALATHCRNHPQTRHLTADIWEVQPKQATGGRPVGLLWASPDCTHHSVAKGGKARESGKRSLAWAVVKWATAVRPRVIFLENVPEFRGWGPLGADDRPIKAQHGETFAEWLAALRELGYVVEHRVLDASHYGTPTRRRRLFLVARLDGQPIAWPEPTHGPGRLPVRTAASCIDWSLPCPSIFERTKPLAEKTLWRIAQGIRRFVLESPNPFLVGVGTITAKNDKAVVSPTLIQTGFGERVGQTPRAPGLHKPLGTIVAGGQKHALVAAFIARHNGGPRPVIGASLETSLPTITAWDHHSLAAVELARVNGTAADHVAEVRAFLTAYYATDAGPNCARSSSDGSSMRMPDVDDLVLGASDRHESDVPHKTKRKRQQTCTWACRNALIAFKRHGTPLAEALVRANPGRDTVRAA